MTIAENLTKVRENIARAAKDAGRDERDVLLIGATKMNDARPRARGDRRRAHGLRRKPRSGAAGEKRTRRI